MLKSNLKIKSEINVYTLFRNTEAEVCVVDATNRFVINDLKYRQETSKTL